MKVLEYRNHPSYNPKDILNGYDISVYMVNDLDLQQVSNVLINIIIIKKKCFNLYYFFLRAKPESYSFNYFRKRILIEETFGLYAYQRMTQK